MRNIKLWHDRIGGCPYKIVAVFCTWPHFEVNYQLPAQRVRLCEQFSLYTKASKKGDQIEIFQAIINRPWRQNEFCAKLRDKRPNGVRRQTIFLIEIGAKQQIVSNLARF